jgi:transcriptional regulator with XRE-family HTH domain
VSRTERWAAFGSSLRRERKAKGLSQRALAEAAGCTYGHIAHLEAGRRGASEDIAYRLEAALSLPKGRLGWVLGYASPPATRTVEQAIKADPTLTSGQKRAFLAALTEVRKINEEDS